MQAVAEPRKRSCRRALAMLGGLLTSWMPPIKPQLRSTRTLGFGEPKLMANGRYWYRGLAADSRSARTGNHSVRNAVLLMPEISKLLRQRGFLHDVLSSSSTM